MTLKEAILREDQSILPVEFYLRKFDQGFSMAFHEHDSYELMYAESGHFTILVEEEGKVRELKVLEGQFVLIDSGVKHKLSINGKVKICCVEFRAQECKENDQRLGYLLEGVDSFHKFINAFQRVQVINDTEDLLPIVKRIQLGLYRLSEETELQTYISSLMAVLFIDIGRAYMNAYYAVSDLYMMKILELIHKNLSGDLSPKNLAKQVHISQSYLHRIFKAHMKCTITNYINEVRVEKAKQLLVHTEYPTIEIGMEVGFNTRQHYRQVFVENTGVSPREYRKQHRDKEYARAVGKKAQIFYEEI